MNQPSCATFTKTAIARVVNHLDEGVIGHLALTQNNGPGDRPKVREPELRHAFAQVAESQGIYYGIEVPTTLRYRFTDGVGARQTSARHDLAILPSAKPSRVREVLVELKEGQPPRQRDCLPIWKDFLKLLREPAEGKAFVHVMQAGDAGTVPALVGKYNMAFKRAARELSEIDRARVIRAKAWFSLFVLVCRMGGRRWRNRPMLCGWELVSLGDAVAAAIQNNEPFVLPPPIEVEM